MIDRFLPPLLLLLTLTTITSCASTISLPGATKTTFEPIALRGYGTVSGTAWESAGGSILHIHCENHTKAALLQAKYLSDLQSLPGVSPTTIADTSAYALASGAIAAGLQGSDVYLFASQSSADLALLLSHAPADLAFTPAAKVPMYLDIWDQYGFRFYYRPWETPIDVEWKDYNVLEEFDFAKQTGSAGFSIWAKPDGTDVGPALTDTPWWDWAERAAGRRDLPVVINTVRSAPTWLLNRYRDQVTAKMPQYCGSFHSVGEPHHDGGRKLSWAADTATDAEYAILQQHVTDAVKRPNTIDYMEPNCELRHGAYDVFLEYGPQADKSYRTFLKQRYHDLATIGKRWHGNTTMLQTWDDIRVPELASFLGWNSDAVDLTGTWSLTKDFSNDEDTGDMDGFGIVAWYDPLYDDSKWPRLTIPGNDQQMFLQKEQTRLRRSFQLDPTWLKGQRTWLYVWDLNFGDHRKTKMAAYLNGEKVGEDVYLHATPHWTAFDVTDKLNSGDNLLGLELPQGYLGYRTYLSHHPPKQYPMLGEQANARWVDFSEWRRWTRLDTCRRGMEMIRQVDPDRPIILAAPDGYFTGILKLAETYGGRFHNTGHMGAFYNDYLPMLMRGSNLPFSLEPGGPARDLAGFKKQLGLYHTEGIQAIHYFIHIGSVMWMNEMRQHFQDTQPLIQTIGKIHPPKAELAVLLSNRADTLMGYPWGDDYNVSLPTGYWPWRFSGILASNYHVDAVTDTDFAPGGNADDYRVVVDTNTTVMDEKTVRELEGWVSRGGTFICMIQTGRHTPERPDSWPISRLTGYTVTHIDPHSASGGEAANRSFTVAGQQSIFPASDWDPQRNYHANGLSLQATAADCQDLLIWEDGTVAAGMRRLGKGLIIQVGLKFGNGRGGAGRDCATLLKRLMEQAELAKLPASIDPDTKGVIFRHSVSNNGLFDAWTLWNQTHDTTITTSLNFHAHQPEALYDIQNQATIAPSAKIVLEPYETRIFLSPRTAIANSPSAWFTLQRGWWRGTAQPTSTALPLPATPFSLNLTENWTYQVLNAKDAGEITADHTQAMAAPDYDDSTWPRRPLTTWAVGEELPGRHLFFRRSFSIPEDWQDGELSLWIRSWFSYTVAGKATYWLDGVKQPAGDGRKGLLLDLDMAPGSTHTLAVEIHGEGQVCGVRGNTRLDFTPAPQATLDLLGEWQSSPDFLTWNGQVKLPSKLRKIRYLRRSFTAPAEWSSGQVYLQVKGGYAITGAVINGRYIRRHHHAIGETTLLNVTPMINLGEENQIDLILGGGLSDHVDDIHLRLYPDGRL